MLNCGQGREGPGVAILAGTRQGPRSSTACTADEVFEALVFDGHDHINKDHTKMMSRAECYLIHNSDNHEHANTTCQISYLCFIAGKHKGSVNVALAGQRFSLD